MKIKHYQFSGVMVVIGLMVAVGGIIWFSAPVEAQTISVMPKSYKSERIILGITTITVVEDHKRGNVCYVGDNSGISCLPMRGAK